MQALESGVCTDCSSPLVDAGDEFVCPVCGAVGEKLVDNHEPGEGRPFVGREALGSYMGSFGGSREERRTRGITGTGGSFLYLKRVSDTAGRDGGSPAECAKLIERVGEKLGLPRVVLVQAAAIARKVLVCVPRKKRVTVAAVSAFSLITACRIEGVASVSASEIMAAHRAQGKRLTPSSVMRFSLDSPVRTLARGARDYVPMVVGRLTANARVRAKLERSGIPRARYLANLRDGAITLLEVLGPDPIAGKRPCAIAGSSVYSAEFSRASAEGRKRVLTQRDIAVASDTAEYTIREQCAELFAPALPALTARLVPPPEAASPARRGLQVPAPQAA